MRQRLPATRPGEIKKVEVGPVTLYITVNRDANGAIREVFAKADEGQKPHADGLAELSSLLLQYECPVKTVVQHLRYRRYPPAGIVNQPCSISDAIGKVLEDEEAATEQMKAGK